jgi:hypothetical protein
MKSFGKEVLYAAISALFFSAGSVGLLEVFTPRVAQAQEGCGGCATVCACSCVTGSTGPVCRPSC